MKASELRIGNYIIYDGEEIRLDVILFSKILKYNWANICEPIPLTEEWFFNFGLVKEAQSLFKSHYNKGALFYEDERCFYLFNINHIKYVHQLQNLYFALTGTELELKDTKTIK